MKTNIKSIIVLTLICFVVGALLAVTNHFTKDKIASHESSAAYEACFDVMPNAVGFEEVKLTDYEGLPNTVKNVYKETSNLGYVYKMEVTGYSPGRVIVCGIDTNGKITKTKTVSSAETPTIGGKTEQDDYTNQYIGKDSTLQGVNAISGATITSNAYKNAILDAFKANAIVAGAEIVLSKEALIATVLPGTTEVVKVNVNINLGNNVTAIYQTKEYTGIAVEVVINEIDYYIGLDYTGKVLGFATSSTNDLSDDFSINNPPQTEAENILVSTINNIVTNKDTLVSSVLKTELTTAINNNNAEFNIYNATFTLPKLEKDLEYIPDYQNTTSIKQLSAEVKAIYESSAGYVYLVEAKGHNGKIVMFVAINKTGAIIDTNVVLQSETASYTNKVWADSYQDKYHGITSLPEDIIATFATVTSTTYSMSVRCALKAYNLMVGGNN